MLSGHFTYIRLLHFTFSAVIMMIFNSVYSIADGLFVANFVSTTGFAAVNLIMPALNILGTFGYMFGTGGSAIIAKTLGEGKTERACGLFSLFVLISIVFGVIMAVPGFVFMRPLASLLGAEGKLLDDCILYGRIFIIALPAWILLYEFQLFFAAAGKPDLGLYLTVAAGVTNAVFDALFIIVFKWGLARAAWASALCQVVGGVLPLLYFGRNNNSLLKLSAPIFDAKAIVKCCSNGSSELMSGVAVSFVNILYNIQLLKYAGENGVAAYGALMYAAMIFSSAFMGFSSGVAPVISYHYGAENHSELQNLRRKSLVIISVLSVSMFTLSEISARQVSAIFANSDSVLLEMTAHGINVYSFSYLFMGIAVFCSSFFTALNNGLISALIAFLRTSVFELGSVLLLPLMFGINGIWASGILAEFLAAASGAAFMFMLRKKYCC